MRLFTQSNRGYSSKSATFGNRWWLMSTLFTINTCKTFGCRNLGLATSEDYSWPNYRLGYPALHCRACGSYPPLFEAQQFNEWVTVYLSAYASESGHFCPVCYGKKTICYGYNPQRTQRVQCCACKKVWTPKRQLPREVISPERIETVPLIVPFRGRKQIRNSMSCSVSMLSEVIFFIYLLILLSTRSGKPYVISGEAISSLIWIAVIS